MSPSIKREHFIPYCRADVIDMCAEDGRLEPGAVDEFRDFCKILESLVHFEHHAQLETLKDSYRPFNPDRDTHEFAPPSADEVPAMRERLTQMLQRVLESANYKHVSEQEIEASFDEAALFQIRLEINFDDYEEVVVYARGERQREEEVPMWYGLRKKTISIAYYERVAIFVKFKPKEHFSEKRLKNMVFEPDTTILKLFQNIPKADMEMLFPNTEVRMRTIDKLFIGVPAVVGGLVVLVTKLAVLGSVFLFLLYWLALITKKSAPPTAAEFITLAIGLGTLGAFIFRQYSNFKNRKIKFMKELTDNLYFRNLDNNAGVFHHLIDAAEEEECKEMILAYYFLVSRDEEFTQKSVDEAVEAWFAEKWKVELDFEVDDAMDKLERLKLAHREGETLRCLSLPDAKRRIDEIWDNYFRYHEAGDAPEPSAAPAD